MLTLIILLSLGVILLVLDIAFIPGMFVGILGGILIISGVFMAYTSISTMVGHITLIGSILFMAGLLYYFYKTDVWSKFSLNDSINSKVNEDLHDLPEKGSVGITLSDLRPSGKAEFNNKIVEVHTLGQFCKTGTKVEVIKVDNRKITVQLIEN